MNFDVSTSLSVLGIVLTVLFFVVGYRQTIGARKERAKAANTQIVDVLFRRLAHEDSFVLTAAAIDKVIDGWALQARVRSGDILGPSEVEALLIARVVENDYISDEQRSSILSRIEQMFREEPESSLVVDADSANPRKRTDSLFLAVASGMGALAASAGLASGALNEAASMPEGLSAAFASMIAAVVLTTIAVAIYSYVREASRSSRLEGLGSASTNIVERNLLRVLQRRVPSVARAANPAIDLTFVADDASYGIEVKADINRLGRVRTKSLAERAKRVAEELGLARVYVLSVAPPNLDLSKYENELVRFMSVREFMSSVQSQGRAWPPR